jgi:hypothetical protein
VIYNVYIIEFNVSHLEQINIVKKFNSLKKDMDVIKNKKLPYRRTWDENDAISFDTLEEYNRRPNKWNLITDNVINNPDFYATLNSQTSQTFNYT